MTVNDIRVSFFTSN